jgi:hypothetical protein
VHVDSALGASALLLVAIALVAVDAPIVRLRQAARGIGALAVTAAAVFPFLWGTPLYGGVELVLLAAAGVWLLVLASVQAPNPTARIALAVTSASHVRSARSSSVASCVHDQ